MPLEEMGAFFDARVEGYEEHMFSCVDGADEYYKETVKYLPDAEGLRLLDLGCGTGLELDELFKRTPRARVTGIDLSAGMLEKLKAKYPLKALRLIRGSYFDVDFGSGAFEAAVSVESLHHFTRDKKVGLYKKILSALVPRGVYVETDYVAEDQAQEDFYFSEYARLRAETTDEGEFFHYDTPHTVENLVSMLKESGFDSVELRWRKANTAILAAKKGGDSPRKILLGSDHVGFVHKSKIREHLEARGFLCEDAGCYSSERADYPVYGEKAARLVAGGRAELGILVCGTGCGISLAANSVKGVRCVNCSEPYTAKLSRNHNDCNMLAIGARVVGDDLALMIVDAFVDASFEAGGRHEKRVNMLKAMDKGI